MGRIEALLFSVWVIRLLKPEWVVTFYVPGLGPIKLIASLFLYALVLYTVLAYTRDLKFDWTFGLYLGAIFCSTVLAHNTGLARKGFGTILDHYLFYVVNLTVISALDNGMAIIDRVFKIYLIALVFYGVSGLIFKGTVPFHVYLNNDDAFGPFMAFGGLMALFLAFREERIDRWIMGVAGLCMVGLIASFTRGAVLSFCCGAFLVWLRSSNKGSMTLVMIIGALMFVIVGSVMFDSGAYWNELATINHSLHDEKSEGRHFLRKKAIELYELNPIFGVGPYNFGPSLALVTLESEAMARGMRLAQYWTRVPHSLYFQILSELGTVGAVAFISIVISFWRKNRQIRKVCKELLLNKGSSENQSNLVIIRKIYYSCLAVEVAMVIYLINGGFYDVMYYHWFPDLVIINSMLYLFAAKEGLMVQPARFPIVSTYSRSKRTVPT